jgi:hypothetical protein
MSKFKNRYSLYKYSIIAVDIQLLINFWTKIIVRLVNRKNVQNKIDLTICLCMVQLFKNIKVTI